MKKRKLLDKIRDFLDGSRQEQSERKKNLRRLLKELRQKERLMEKKLEGSKDKKANKRLKNEINTICAQRRKGVKLLKEL